MSKKQQVKDVAMSLQETMTLNDWQYYFSGARWGSRTKPKVMEVSRATIRRALDELVDEGLYKKYMWYGHCYDQWRYVKVKEKLYCDYCDNELNNGNCQNCGTPTLG